MSIDYRFGTVWTSNIKLNGKGHAVPGQWTISVQVPRKTCIFKVQAKTAMGFVFNILGKDGAAEDYQVRIVLVLLNDKYDKYKNVSAVLYIDNSKCSLSIKCECEM